MKIMPNRLPRTQLATAIFHAGRFCAARDHWLLQAKGSIDDRSFYVAYAKSAHRDYMNALRLVSEISESTRIAA